MPLPLHLLELAILKFNVSSCVKTSCFHFDYCTSRLQAQSVISLINLSIAYTLKCFFVFDNTCNLQYSLVNQINNHARNDYHFMYSHLSGIMRINAYEHTVKRITHTISKNTNQRNIIDVSLKLTIDTLISTTKKRYR